MSAATNYSDTIGVLSYGYSEAEVAALMADPQPTSNRPSTVMGVTIPFMVLSWLCVAFRLHTRLRVVHAAGWDDLCVALALLFLTAGTIAVILACKRGMLGYHVAVLTIPQWEAYDSNFYVMNASYVVATALIKLSLLLQYTRLFAAGTLLRRTCWALIVFTALWAAAYGFIAWFPCFPMSNFWRNNNVNCYGYGSTELGPFVATFESHSGVNMVLDLVVLAIPVPLYFDRDSSSRTKVGLVGLLLMGAIVNFVSIWRLVTIVEHRAATYPYHDPTWWAPITITLANLEVALACVCASVPVFWPVLESRFGSAIFVEHEIEVRVEHATDDRWSSGHARGDSDGELAKLDGGAASGDEMGLQAGAAPGDSSFKEVYVMSQIDPLRRDRTAMHHATIRSHSEARSGSRQGGKRKWWRL